jgi:hypothetical protein
MLLSYHQNDHIVVLYVDQTPNAMFVIFPQVTSESVSTRQREGGSLPCSVNEVQLINFTQGDYNGDTRSSMEDLRWGSMHKLPANQETSCGSSPKPASSPIEMTSMESRSADESMDGEIFYKDCEKRDLRSKMGMSHASALQQEKIAVMERAKEAVDREKAASFFKNSVSLEVNPKEPEEVDKQTTYFPDKIFKVCIVLVEFFLFQNYLMIL